jgi:hypothetical protein
MFMENEYLYRNILHLSLPNKCRICRSKKLKDDLEDEVVWMNNWDEFNLINSEYEYW